MTKKEFNRVISLWNKHNSYYTDGRQVHFISAYTRKGEDIIRSCERFTARDIYGAYSSPSQAKVKICEDLLSRYRLIDNARDFHICSRGSNFFSVGWIVDHYTEETETATEWVYFTVGNEYHVYTSKGVEE